MHLTFCLSSGADVQAARPSPDKNTGSIEPSVRRDILRKFVSNNLDITHTFSNHPKILITALNGPVVGLSAALIAFSDFIYAMPHTFLLTPFSSLGLVAEGGASAAFVQRLGVSKANEALIMSKRITAEEMVQVGFINKIFTDIDPQAADANQKFMAEVLKEVEERLGGHLNRESLLKIKALLKHSAREEVDKANYREVYEGMDRFLKGIPQEEFRKIASGQKRHKL
jgi:enoyl-CoA hydratase/carnithine racemase